MEFTIHKVNNNTAVIYFTGSISGDYQIIQLNDEFDFLSDEGFSNFVFELSHLKYLNSSGLNFFLRLLTKVRKDDGEIILSALHRELHKLLVTTKLNSFFTITDTVQQGLDHLAKEKA